MIIGGGLGGLYAARGLAVAPVGIAPAAVFFTADDSKWITGNASHLGGLRYIVQAHGSATGKGTKT